MNEHDQIIQSDIARWKKRLDELGISYVIHTETKRTVVLALPKEGMDELLGANPPDGLAEIAKAFG